MTIVKSNTLQKEARRKEVLRIFREKPHVRISMVAKTLGVHSSTIGNDMRELSEELKRQNPTEWHMHRERMLLDLNKMMKKCIDKLDLCRGAVAGSRWVEEWSKLFEKEAKILGVYSPDKSVVGHVNLDEMINKEQRDAALNALILGQEKDIIDITPKNEITET